MSNPRRPRRRQQRAIDTRQRILDTAGALFVADSYEGTSISDLITAARTSKGAFYRHFPGGKLEVATAIMENTLTMDGLVEQRIMLQEVVDIGMILAHRISHESALQAALMLSFHSSAPETYGTPWPDWIVFNAGQLTEARRRGELKPFVDPEQQAHQIAGGWAGVVLISNTLDRHLGNVEERVSRMYRNLVTAIAVPEVLPELDLSVNRGRCLYTAFLEGAPAPDRSHGETAEEPPE
ncbi:TetR family transcriptional regulator [Streptomyces sp. Ag109_O5-1]|uniref:TetR/AcrR family transcriptional regulator n=1 Tax=Streptomyces sp. Ag109_O5-1 TaxID=1938851 RepID=UPI000F4F4052|nr:TetR/AcrR family transcriptional regulator [Streptomyces sp. Ag109_O5-1]RPE39598.1 TetR family transcriptional regulator [Streptomyces sp. Ag109_O5-1]